VQHLDCIARELAFVTTARSTVLRQLEQQLAGALQSGIAADMAAAVQGLAALGAARSAADAVLQRPTTDAARAVAAACDPRGACFLLGAGCAQS
jgi:hypothetical protein